jgi:glutamate N-acetyltransferase / amino-acid N-acetyltransferase
VKVAAQGRLLVEALPAAGAAMKEAEFSVLLDLKLGKASAKILTCDLSYDYVRINAEYTT